MKKTSKWVRLSCDRYTVVYYFLTSYADEGGDAPEEEDDSNALDLADPVDILSKVSPNFFELLVST